MLGLALLFVCVFLLSFQHFDHIAWGRGSWSFCLSYICLLDKHKLTCVTFSLPPGVGGWLRLLLLALPGLFCLPLFITNTDYQPSFPCFTIHRHMFYCSSVNNCPNIRQRCWRSSSSTSWRNWSFTCQPPLCNVHQQINFPDIYTIVRNYDIIPSHPSVPHMFCSI